MTRDEGATPRGRPAPWRRPRPRAALGVALVALAVVLGAVRLAGTLAPAPAARSLAAHARTAACTAPRVGCAAPGVTLLDLSGRPVSLARYRGDVVLVNFWYAACVPCEIEMPALERVYQQDHARGFLVVGVDVSDDAPTISHYAAAIGLTYPLLRDDAGHAAIAYGVLATPTSFLIGRHGTVRAVERGGYDLTTLAAAVTPLLGAR